MPTGNLRKGTRLCEGYPRTCTHAHPLSSIYSRQLASSFVKICLKRHMPMLFLRSPDLSPQHLVKPLALPCIFSIIPLGQEDLGYMWLTSHLNKCRIGLTLLTTAWRPVCETGIQKIRHRQSVLWSTRPDRPRKGSWIALYTCRSGKGSLTVCPVRTKRIALASTGQCSRWGKFG